jgi:hypothetical protein
MGANLCGVPSKLTHETETDWPSPLPRSTRVQAHFGILAESANSTRNQARA